MTAVWPAWLTSGLALRGHLLVDAQTQALWVRSKLPPKGLLQLQERAGFGHLGPERLPARWTDAELHISNGDQGLFEVAACYAACLLSAGVKGYQGVSTAAECVLQLGTLGVHEPAQYFLGDGSTWK